MTVIPESVNIPESESSVRSAMVPQPRDGTDAVYVDPTLALPRNWWFSTLQWTVVIIAAGGDAANFYLALATVAELMPTALLVSAVSALTVAAVSIMYAVGVSARDFSARSVRFYRAPSLMTLVFLWAALGAAAFVLRLLGTSDVASGGIGGLSFEDGTSAGGANHDQLLLSLIMLMLYLATGGLAAWFAFHTHNPFYAAARRAHVAITRINRKVAALHVLEVRYEEQVTLLLDEEHREAERKSEDLAICRAQAAELKELARSELAIRLGDPAATTAITRTDLGGPRRVESEL